MTIESETDFVCAGVSVSVTVAVRLKVPLAVGVPETMPVAVPRLSPAGRAPEVIDQLYGVFPPVACMPLE
jgi:hypothetical protein